MNRRAQAVWFINKLSQKEQNDGYWASTIWRCFGIIAGVKVDKRAGCCERPSLSQDLWQNRPKQQISAPTAASRLTACFTGSSSKTASKVSEGDQVTFYRLWQSSLRKPVMASVFFLSCYVILEYHHLLFRQRWLKEIEYALIQCSLNAFMC